MSAKHTPGPCITPICLACNMGPCRREAARYDAEYVPGIGWMAVTPTGRYGNFDTEAQALRAALAKATGSN